MSQDAPSSAGSFSSVPILDWSLLTTPAGAATFKAQLRHALINVGFLYLENPPVARADMDALIAYTPRVFDLPQDEKDAVRMANSPHFFGYSRLGAELTKGKTDMREQFDFGTPYESRWKPGDPEYLKLWGPSQASHSLSVPLPLLVMLTSQLQPYSGRKRIYSRASKMCTCGTSRRSSSSATTSSPSSRRC